MLDMGMPVPFPTIPDSLDVSIWGSAPRQQKLIHIQSLHRCALGAQAFRLYPHVCSAPAHSSVNLCQIFPERSNLAPMLNQTAKVLPWRRNIVQGWNWAAALLDIFIWQQTSHATLKTQIMIFLFLSLGFALSCQRVWLGSPTL